VRCEQGEFTVFKFAVAAVSAALMIGATPASAQYRFSTKEPVFAE